MRVSEIADRQEEFPSVYPDKPLLDKAHKVIRVLKRGYVLKQEKYGLGRGRYKNDGRLYHPHLHKLENNGNNEMIESATPDYRVSYEVTRKLINYDPDETVTVYNEKNAIYIYWKNTLDNIWDFIGVVNHDY